MIKSFLSLCIFVAFGFLAISIIRPELATTITNRVLGGVVETARIQGVPVSEDQEAPREEIVSVITSYFQSPQKNGNNTMTVDGIIDATNVERVANDLPPLITNNKLIAAATLKVNDMSTKHYFEHVSPTGKNVSDLGSAVGYDFIIMGENLAFGDFTTATDLLTAWMNSPGHRANILNASYTEIGVYAARGTYNGREGWFAVQHFGTPRSSCPAIDATLKTAISKLNADLKKREAIIAAARVDLENPDQDSGEAYKAKIARFNSLVSEYNTLLTLSQKQIISYNKQVVAFNKCLALYQKEETH